MKKIAGVDKFFEEHHLQQIGEAAEKQVISDIQQASSGAIVKVDMTNDDGSLATVVTKEMLLAVQDKDVTLVLDMGDLLFDGDHCHCKFVLLQRHCAAFQQADPS